VSSGEYIPAAAFHATVATVTSEFRNDFGSEAQLNHFYPNALLTIIILETLGMRLGPVGLVSRSLPSTGRARSADHTLLRLDYFSSIFCASGRSFDDPPAINV
jgi:hypothetical protein